MLWRSVLTGLVVLGFARDARANGRAPGTSSIHFEQGHEANVIAGMTFGLVISHDGGATWSWMCEKAIGYSGMYDPRYTFSQSGAIFATTFAGLKVNRNACTFDPMPSGKTFASTVTLGSDHALYYAAAQGPVNTDPGDSDIHRSTDDGMTFPVMSKPGQINDWWQTLVVAPSNAQRLYLSGFRMVNPGGDAGTVKVHLLFRSSDGGQSWTQLPVTDFTLMSNSAIDVVGVSASNPDHVFARVELEDNTLTDSLWKSSDGGQTWTRIYTKNTALSAFVARANGDIVVGTQALGAEISHDEGAQWTPLANAPHMNCLVENSAGEVWACTQNYGQPGIGSDDAGIMKSTDLATWTKVLRYQDLKAPVDCPAGTSQHDDCATTWCTFCQQLGCRPDASFNCPADTDAPVVTPGKKTGCCDASDGGTSALALGFIVGMVLVRRRRGM